MTGEDGKTRKRENEETGRGKGREWESGKGALPYLAPAGRHVYRPRDTQTS